eukprot:TRINITY_DN26432_c0_g1_i1.p1 TRINITY_DN26432_c0_g1~~TRINITY_DN26432_c0_g1_i1.p1  ORF type:complete len:966 (-),score=165.72 TRINITY_DN26432_c0_g1_i1:280-3105(-)
MQRASNPHAAAAAASQRRLNARRRAAGLGAGGADAAGGGHSLDSSAISTKEAADALARPDGECRSIQVAVRARPLNQKELCSGATESWTCTNNQVRELSAAARGGRVHTFDHVFGPSATTAEVYACQCASVVEGAMRGYNGTVFAYGQTSSGKTHTMMGDLDVDPGVAPLAIRDVFRWVAAHAACSEYCVRASYLEIYNECLTDLLRGSVATGASPPLKIVEDKARGAEVRGLTEETVTSGQQCLDLLVRGETRRTFGATAMNTRSSRSHVLFCLRITSKERTGTDANGKALMQTVATEFLSTQRSLAADHASLYLVDDESGELYTASGDITLRLPLTQGVAGAAAMGRRSINIEDAYKDPRFDETVDRKTGYRTSSLLCVPILADGAAVGVVQFINKTLENGSVGRFSEADEGRAAELVRKISPLIAAAQRSVEASVSSRLNLVDLAGSERQKAAGSSGVVLKEACHINTSLMTLGNIIDILSEGKNQHIPFRNSKLTHILSTSLKGNTNTCMLCAVSPSSCNKMETLSTLQFASRAKKIVNIVTKNTHKDQSELIRAYEQEIAMLKSQIMASPESLLAQLNAAQAEAAAARAELAATRRKLDEALTLNASQDVYYSERRQRDGEKAANESATELDSTPRSAEVRKTRFMCRDALFADSSQHLHVEVASPKTSRCVEPQSKVDLYGTLMKLPEEGSKWPIKVARGISAPMDTRSEKLKVRVVPPAVQFSLPPSPALSARASRHCSSPKPVTERFCYVGSPGYAVRQVQQVTRVRETARSISPRPLSSPRVNVAQGGRQALASSGYISPLRPRSPCSRSVSPCRLQPAVCAPVRVSIPNVAHAAMTFSGSQYVQTVSCASSVLAGETQQVLPLGMTAAPCTPSSAQASETHPVAAVWPTSAVNHNGLSRAAGYSSLHGTSSPRRGGHYVLKQVFIWEEGTR